MLVQGVTQVLVFHGCAVCGRGCIPQISHSPAVIGESSVSPEQVESPVVRKCERKDLQQCKALGNAAGARPDRAAGDSPQPHARMSLPAGKLGPASPAHLLLQSIAFLSSVQP